MVEERRTSDRKCALLERVHGCSICGLDFGNSAVGFGKTDSPLVFFVGTNPWVKNHKFVDGRGIRKLKTKLKLWKFTDFFFDNVVKCEMPNRGTPGSEQAENCLRFLEQQIEAIKPRSFVVFGRFAVEFLGLQLRPWEIGQYCGRPAAAVPHFSSPLYDGLDAVHIYYKKLKELLGDIREVLDA